jgi:hypothetical protein
MRSTQFYVAMILCAGLFAGRRVPRRRFSIKDDLLFWKNDIF